MSSTSLPVKNIILQGGSGSVVGTLAANLKTLTPSSLQYKNLTGTMTNVASGTNTNITLSGFDANYAASGANNNSIILKPGVYNMVFSIRFGFPGTGNGSQYVTLNIFPYSGGTVLAPMTQQSNGYSGWPSGSGTFLQMASIVNVPAGVAGGFTPIVANNLGVTISSIDVGIVISQIYQY